MGAIGGQVAFAGRAPESSGFLYSSMLDSMACRGPDQREIFADETAALLQTRLRESGCAMKRPLLALSFGGEEYALVYDGKLDNAPDLRRALLAAGHDLTDFSDAQALLRAYAEWGEGCLSRLHGVFAFAIWASKAKRLFFARDPMGAKPLFYCGKNEGFLFASRIKTLLCHPALRPEIDSRAVAELLLIGPGRTPGCGVFRGVEELKPGCCGVYERAGLRVWPYWRLREEEHTENFADTVAHVRWLIKDSVHRQATSAPACVFLSGGLDSSMIAALADAEMAGQGRLLHTFSVDFQEKEQSPAPQTSAPDAQDAQIMRRALRGRHHRLTLRAEALCEALRDAVDARDLPGMGDADAWLLLLCREMKKTAPIALSGECGDELFGGNSWCLDPDLRARRGFPWAQATAWRASFLRPEIVSGLFPEDYAARRYEETVGLARALPTDTPIDRRMRELYQLNFSWYMQTLLERNDRMSLAAGLETRLPFCDDRLAQYLYNVPWKYKDNRGLLRRAVTGILPEIVGRREKSALRPPYHPGYFRLICDQLRAVIDDPNAPLLQIVDREALRRLLTAERAIPWYGPWMAVPQTAAYMLQMDYWLRQYRVRLV